LSWKIRPNSNAAQGRKKEASGPKDPEVVTVATTAQEEAGKGETGPYVPGAPRENFSDRVHIMLPEIFAAAAFISKYVCI